MTEQERKELREKLIVPGHHSCNVSLKNPFQLQEGKTVVQAIEK